MPSFHSALERPAAGLRLLAAAALAVHMAPAGAQVDLADRPPRTTQSVPANVLLALSVEWPTGSVQAYNDEQINGCGGRVSGHSVCYFDPPQRASLANAANGANANWRTRTSMPYLGYFDPFKCYAYNASGNWFEPVGPTIGWVDAPADQQPATSRARCSGYWSGNFLNWSTMHTIDLFRWAMTGGSRSAGLDTTSITVLEKAAHWGDGGTDQFPNKLIDASLNGGTSPSDVAPAPAGTRQLYVRVQGLGTQMRVDTDANVDSGGVTLSVRVKVCVADASRNIKRESNCKAYAPALADSDASNDAGVDPSTVTYKPVGLIQQNAMAVRFAAFGYLLDGDPNRDGGVMRARMKFVGPNQPARSAAGQIANSAAEWDRNTGIFIGNPDASDATATNSAFGLSGSDRVTRSGVIQYLNEFGRRNGYKAYDPVSEMYYEAIRYYKNLGPTPEYYNLSLTGGSAGQKVDGFPVIATWDDPLAPPAGYAGSDLQEWCPKNFVIGIADANAHKDKRLPGNTFTDGYDSPAQPGSADSAINVSSLLNEIIATEQANEGVALLNSAGGALTAGVANFCCNGSAYVASLAYYANTRDLRPDSTAIQTKGKQTVQTFYVDVRESGSWGTGVSRTDPRRRNQLWLAAKYGGFPDANVSGRLDIGDATNDYNRDGRIDVRDAWDKDGDWLPDTYYEASTPEALVEGLQNAFAQINARVASAAGVGMSTKSIELTADTGLYRVNYDPRTWSGSLIGYRYVGFDVATGAVSTATSWNAADRLVQQNWDTGRRIATWRTGSGNSSGAVPFRWNRLSGAQKTALGGDSSMVDFLRGRNDLPGLRPRVRYDDLGRVQSAVLGDIVNSEPRYVGAPAAPYADPFNPGYGAFKTARAARRGVLYVGANDGMLHAFDADTDASSATGGTELFAYVPSFLYNGPTAPEVDGLRALSGTAYAHRYYVDATPAVGDVDFARTFSASGTSLARVPATTTADWHTVLVAGLGKGGRGFFAIDVTDPDAFGSETAVAGKVLWEFDDPDMGFSFGLPQFAKTRRWGWVVLLTSGYNPARAPGSSAGAYLYVVDPRSGDLLQKIAVPGSGVSTGLAQVTAYAPDATDGTITEVYGGDLQGNVWRFDFNADTGTMPAPIRYATLVNPGGAAQPITTGPLVRVAPITRNRYVFVGTGRMLGVSDLYDASVQSFYALRDGTSAKAWQPGGLPAPIDFPLTRAKIVRQADLTSAIARDPARPGGWYTDLTTAGERVIVDPADTDFGKVSWLGSIPDGNNPCTPAGGARIYAASFESAQSQLFNPALLLGNQRVRVASLDPGTGAVGLRLVRVDGNIRAVVTGQYNELRLTQGYLRYLNPRSLNWREVLEPGQ